MQGIVNAPNELPEHVQTILNAIAFLISSGIVWYAYFVKGKKEAAASAPTVPANQNQQATLLLPVAHPELINGLSTQLERIAHSLEEAVSIMRSNATEAEIERRVKEKLERRRKGQGS